MAAQRSREEAQRLADELAQQLGWGWTTEVWETYGWHYTATRYFAGLFVTVGPTMFGQYSATASATRLAGVGDSPQQAVTVLREAFEAKAHRMANEYEQLIAVITALRQK